MLIKISLQCFKKHEALELTFSEGLNVIRAANEQGKSTLYEAITYALWGARALPLSLEDTVTWGKPVSKLQVELTFAVAGVVYTVKRSKSGAELSGTATVTGSTPVTAITAAGHAAVTSAIETLLGASMGVGMATLNASQGSLQSSLSGDSLNLIEKLANLGLIDSLVSKIQESLPSGSTRVLEERLEVLQAERAPEFSGADLASAVQAAKSNLEAAEAELSQLAGSVAEKQQAAKLAENQIQEIKANRGLRASAEAKIQQFSKPIQMPELNSVFSESELLQLIDKQQADLLVRAAFEAFQKLPKANSVNKSVSQVEEDAASLKKESARLAGEIRELEDKRLMVECSGIQGEVCPLCQKNLSDIPEVVAINQKVAVELAELSERLAKLSAQKAEVDTNLQACKTLLAQCTPYNIFKMGAANQHVQWDESKCPEVPRWAGPPVPVEADATDYKALLKALRTGLAAVQEARLREAAREASLTQATQLLAELPADIDTAPLEKIVADFAALQAAVRIATSARDKKREAVVSAQHALELSEAAHRAACTAYEAKLGQALQIQGDIAQMQKHNALIKKLKDVRPVVAKKVWNLVLGGVSEIFSSIRGVTSTVTRQDSRFLIDGKDCAAYSGSTKDALGLAIRIMLQKTFLPGIDFMLLDEVGASSDETREADMLAAVLSADMRQALLVTHSNVADNFAAKLIEL